LNQQSSITHHLSYWEDSRNDAQTLMSSFNFVEPYLRSVFGFLGMTDATFLTRAELLHSTKGGTAMRSRPVSSSRASHAQTI
jgi:hypothetical protein